MGRSPHHLQENIKSIATTIDNEDQTLTKLQQPEQKNQMEIELGQEIDKEPATWKDDSTISSEFDKNLELGENQLKTKKWKDEESE